MPAVVIRLTISYARKLNCNCHIGIMAAAMSPTFVVIIGNRSQASVYNTILIKNKHYGSMPATTGKSASMRMRIYSCHTDGIFK